MQAQFFDLEKTLVWHYYPQPPGFHNYGQAVGFSIWTTFRSCRQADAKLKSSLGTRQQILQALASCVQSRQCFCKHAARTIHFDIKNEAAIKKPENLRETSASH
jgi:hypothetical protein